MSDTIATHHKEWLEEKKDEFDAQIEAMRVTRDNAEDEGNNKLVELMDKGIDDLLAKKDNLTFPEAEQDDLRTEWERDWDDYCVDVEETNRDISEMARGR